MMTTYNILQLPINLNGERVTASVKFAGKSDFGFLTEWKDKLGEDQNPYRVATIELAQLAVHRFSAHSSIQPYLKSIDDLADHIASEPMCEVAGLILLKCDWFSDSQVIGLCHFRRAWCNNIILDYLAVHPYIARKPEGYRHHVEGAGTALVYFLSRVAQKHSCGYIWGEATQLSCGFYKHILLLDQVEDLILAPREKFIKFADGLDLGWQNRGDTEMTKALAVEEVYSTEETNSALVGNKTAMFSPARILANHFLELPTQVQMEIVRTLDLLEEEDATLQSNQLFRNIFRRATERGKLASLWTEVETRHSDGEPGKNPFLES
jgi:hypothetical protein